MRIRLSRALREKAWATDQADPDNWLRIPDLDAKPIDCDFKGFAFPVVRPGIDHDFAVPIRGMLRSLRRVARSEFQSLALLQSAARETIDSTGRVSWRQLFAVMYLLTIQTLDTAISQHDRRKYQQSSHSLANAGQSFSELMALLALHYAAPNAKVIPRRRLSEYMAQIGTQGAKMKHQTNQSAKEAALRLYKAKSWKTVTAAYEEIAPKVAKATSTVKKWIEAERRAERLGFPGN